MSPAPPPVMGPIAGRWYTFRHGCEEEKQEKSKEDPRKKDSNQESLNQDLKEEVREEESRAAQGRSPADRERVEPSSKEVLGFGAPPPQFFGRQFGADPGPLGRHRFRRLVEPRRRGFGKRG